MKKITALLLTLALVLSVSLTFTGCFNLFKKPAQTNPGDQPSTDKDTVINVGYFAGTTGLGMVKMINDNDAKYTFTKFSGPDTIIPAFARGDIDIAALPTNAAPNVFKATNGKAQLLAINTLGVLYVCTNGAEVNSLNDLAGKTIYVPEAAPKLVLKYVLDTAGVQNYTLSDEYNLDTLPGALAQGKAPIALLPEPKVTVISNKEPGKVSIALNVSDEWDRVSESPLVQGCLIVNPTFAEENPNLMNSFLADYEGSIEFMRTPANLENAAEMTAATGILPSAAVAESAIPRSNITFMTNDAMKQAAIGFYSALGIQSPDDSFYYNTNQ